MRVILYIETTRMSSQPWISIKGTSKYLAENTSTSCLVDYRVVSVTVLLLLLLLLLLCITQISVHIWTTSSIGWLSSMSYFWRQQRLVVIIYDVVIAALSRALLVCICWVNNSGRFDRWGSDMFLLLLQLSLSLSYIYHLKGSLSLIKSVTWRFCRLFLRGMIRSLISLDQRVLELVCRGNHLLRVRNLLLVHIVMKPWNQSIVIH